MSKNLSSKQRAELQSQGYTMEELPPTDSQPFTWWYNEGLRKEAYLPADSYSVKQYRRKGWKQGKLPESLKPQPAERTEQLSLF